MSDQETPPIPTGETCVICDRGATMIVQWGEEMSELHVCQTHGEHMLENLPGMERVDNR